MLRYLRIDGSYGLLVNFLHGESSFTYVGNGFPISRLHFAFHNTHYLRCGGSLIALSYPKRTIRVPCVTDCLTSRGVGFQSEKIKITFTHKPYHEVHALA